MIGARIHLPWAEDAGSLADEPLTTAKQRWCAHKGVRLDATARRVYCRSCGREVDAFTALESLAADFDRWRSALDHVRREYEQRAAELEELKREERNARARKRRRA